MSTLVQTVFNVPTLSGQVAGTNTIQLTATLSAASAETVGYMNEARAYIDSIDASISQRYQDIRLFNDAIMSTDNTFLDSNSESRMTWRAMENFASASNWLTLQNTVTSHSELLNDIELNRTALNNSVSTLTTANGLQNTRLDALEATIAPYADDLATLNGEIAGHSTVLNTLQLFDTWVNSELTTLGLQVESQGIRITNTEDTYASQNVLIQSLLDQGTAHDARLELVEASTNIEVQTARFNAIDLAVANNSTQIDSVAADFTAYQQTQTALDAGQDQAILANTQAINTEITDRTAADSALDNQISAVNTALNTETANRLAADTALNNQINTVSTALDTETSNRSAADTALGNQITTLESNLLADIATRALRDGPETYTGEKTFLMGANEVLTVSGTVNFGGDVNIAGSLNTVNATQVDIDDSVINLNAGETGTPSQNAGIVVERGTELNAQLQWNEATDRWQAGLDGSLQNLVLQSELNSSVNGADATSVKLTGNQTIDGNKTFTGITRMDSARTDNLATDTAAFIFTHSPLRYAAAAVGNIVNDNELINKGYVDAGLDTKFNLTGGFLSGNLTIDAPSAAVVLNSNAGTHAQISFREASVVKGFLYHDFANDILRLQRRNGTTTTNELQLRDTYGLITNDLRVTNPGTQPSSYQTKQQIEDNFLALTGGTVTNNLTINNTSSESVTAVLRIDSRDDGGWAGVDLINQGIRGALLYRNGTGSTPGIDSGTLRIRRYDTINGTITSELNLGNNFIDSSRSLSLNNVERDNRQIRFNNTGTSGQTQGGLFFYENGSLDSQVYASVHSLVLQKNPNSNIVIGNTSTLLRGDLKIQDTNAAILTLNSEAGNSEIRFENNGTLTGQQYVIPNGVHDRFVVLKRDNSAIGGTQTNSIAIYGDHATISHSTTASHPDTALTTKDYADSHLKLTGGYLTGEVLFENGTEANRRITFNNPGAAGPKEGELMWRQQSVASASIFNNQNALTLRRFGGTSVSQIHIWDNNLTADSGSFTLNGTQFGNTTVVRCRNDSDTGWTGFDFADVGQRSALIYRPGRGTTPGVDAGQLRFRLYDLETNNVSSEIVMNHGSISSNVPLFAPLSANEATVVPRSYIDNNFLPLTGGWLTGFLSVSAPGGTIAARATTDSAVSQFQLYNQNHLVMQMYGISHNAGANDRFSIVKRDNTSVGGTQTNSISIYGDHVRTSHSTLSGHPPTSLVTKDYVDTHAKISSGNTFTGYNTFTGTTDIRGFLRNGITDVLLVDSDIVMTAKSGTEGGRVEFREASNNGTGAVALQGPDNVDGKHIYKMPSTLPTVGQQLTAVAVNGNTVTLGWT